MTALGAGWTCLCTAILLVGCEGREATSVDAADTGAPDAPPVVGCSTEPQTLARLDPAALDLEVDEHNVYIGRQGGLWRLPRTGGALEPIASMPEREHVFQLYRRGPDLYWVKRTYTGPPQYYVESLHRSDMAALGGPTDMPRAPPETLATSAFIRLLEIDSDRLHFVSTAGLHRLGPDDQQDVIDVSFGRWFYADRHAAYWVEGILDAAVTRTLPLAGGPVGIWRPGSYRIVASDADSLYAMKYLSPPIDRNQWQVLRIARDGSSDSPLAGIIDPSDGGDYRFVRDGQSLYWSDETGQVWRASVGGGPPVSVARGPGFDVDDSFPPLLVAVDESHVYWQVAPPDVIPGEHEPGPMVLVRACK
jgi:hypothetical protein